MIALLTLFVWLYGALAISTFCVTRAWHIHTWGRWTRADALYVLCVSLTVGPFIAIVAFARAIWRSLRRG
jgi:hypothetical protein